MISQKGDGVTDFLGASSWKPIGRKVAGSVAGEKREKGEDEKKRKKESGEKEGHLLFQCFYHYRQTETERGCPEECRGKFEKLRGREGREKVLGERLPLPEVSFLPGSGVLPFRIGLT